MPMPSRSIPNTQDQYGRSCATVCICGQTSNRTNAGRAITPFMFNKEEYCVSVPEFIVMHVLNVSKYACDEDGVEYPSAMDFYCCSNTHDPDQDRFEDPYRHDFIHAINHVAHRKLARHHLDPYQHATFHCGIIRHNMGEEEANPALELAMEYAGALGTIIFDESCQLQDLTEAQIGRNQFAVDVAVD